MQVTVKCFSGKKKTVVQDDYISTFLDYHYLSKGLRLRKRTSTKNANAQGKTRDHLDFILTFLCGELRTSALVREHVSQRTDRISPC